MIAFTFEGTSHGEGYKGKITGLPHFDIDVDKINEQLALRKQGYGRSNRQNFEDKVQLTYYNGTIEFFVPNKCVEQREDITAVRSGHADLVGACRYNVSARQVAETSSARNSICYVVLGAICKQWIAKYGISTYSYVTQIGNVVSYARYTHGVTNNKQHFGVLHCPSVSATNKMTALIDSYRSNFNSLGGKVVVCASGVPMGVGEIFPYADKLDAILAGNLMAIPSVKAVEFGLGTSYASTDGVSCADSLIVSDGAIKYATNNCGGIVAGVTTGEPITCTLTVKPVPTVKNVLTVDTATHNVVPQHYERADTCVVPNVGVIAENIMAYVIANQLIKQGYDK